MSNITINDILPFAEIDETAYSGWAAMPYTDGPALAALLRRVAADLEEGRAVPLGTSGHVVHYYLGTDSDGTENVNLDTGHRALAIGLRYGMAAPMAQAEAANDQEPVPGA